MEKALYALAAFLTGFVPLVTVLWKRTRDKADTGDVQDQRWQRLLNELEKFQAQQVSYWRDRYDECHQDKAMMVKLVEELRMEIARLRKG